jgi:hypothetical protein
VQQGKVKAKAEVQVKVEAEVKAKVKAKAKVMNEDGRRMTRDGRLRTED